MIIPIKDLVPDEVRKIADKEFEHWKSGITKFICPKCKINYCFSLHAARPEDCFVCHTKLEVVE